MASLNDAIQLIREGSKEQARQLLEPLLKAEPGNIQAWFWYVDTCSTLEKRIQVLEICLKMNPGNAQVTQALQTLRGQRSSQTSFSQPPASSPKPAVSPPQQSTSSYSSIFAEESRDPASSSYTSAYFDEKSTYVPNTATQQPQSQQRNAWEVDNGSYVDTSLLSKPKTVKRTYAFYDAWITVLATLDIGAYEDVLNDPEAGAGRAFEWIAYTGIISGLIAPLALLSNPQFIELMAMPEFEAVFGNMGSTAFAVILALILALLTPILSVIGLAISAGIQNFLALFFGGNGYYGRTVYAIAAYLAPMTILVALLGIIPLVGQCLTSLLGLYNIVLNVRALRAAHSISIWQALGVMFAPTIIIIILGCILVFAVGLPGLSS